MAVVFDFFLYFRRNTMYVSSALLINIENTKIVFRKTDVIVNVTFNNVSVI